MCSRHIKYIGSFKKKVYLKIKTNLGSSWRSTYIDNAIILLCYCHFGEPELIALLSLKGKV